MRILVFGRTGQVATELARQAPVIALGRDAADLTDPAACAEAVRQSGADAVINAAAFTAVDRAESAPETARTVNAEAPAAMAEAAAGCGVPFLHVSTDYVFDGSGTAPWREDDPTAPLNVYGQTKRDGEEAVLAAGGRALVLRTSWVFSAHGTNFVKTMLALGQDRDALPIVDDQVGGPTPAADIAATLMGLARALCDGAPGGIYHYSGRPAASWADFAVEIFRQAGLAVAVRRIPSRDYPTPARRPLNARLNCRAIARDFGVSQPDWRAGLARVLGELEQ